MGKNKRSERLDPDEVLQGRVRPNARELLTLIHDVNPSGHELPSRDNARRYALKSRLQSLLVRRFPDEILVEPGDEPAVVGLRHRASGADACHALLATLDEDARSWVQLQLDLGGDEEEGARTLTPRSEVPSGPRSGAPLDDLSTDELLRRGRAALKDYDYPAAHERFLAAFERGHREAALLVLTVLVEHLGLDTEALALEERLDDAALAAPEIRLLLALAAARTYQRPRALRLVRAEGGDAAAEVFAALARGAIERDELDHAAADVSEIQRRGPSHPALLGLGDRVKMRRAEERAPLEGEAQRLFHEGRYDEAEAQAKALAARWPESAVAQAITRAGQERRRRDEARALGRQGSAELAAGDAARALGLLRRAIAMGLPDDDAAVAQRDVALAEAAERERAERERAAILVHSLKHGGPTLRALTEYLTLDEPRRLIVLQACRLVELAYLEQAGFLGAGSDARAAAQAVIALQRAIHVSQTDPGSAVDLITAHWAHLHPIPDAGTALHTAHELAGLRAHLDAQRQFTEGLRAMDGTKEGLARALKILSGVRREDLPDPEKLDSIRVSMRLMSERMDRAVEIGKLREAGRLVEARDALDAMMRFEESARSTDPDMQDPAIDWKAKRDEVMAQIAKQTDLRLSAPPSDEHLLGVEAPRLLDVPESLLPGGQEILLVECRLGIIFLQTLDVASGRVRRRATVRMSKPFEVGRVQQRAGRVVLLGSGETRIDICVDRWEIVSAVSGTNPENRTDQAILAPGGRFLWVTERRDGWWTRISVDDSERHAYVKDFSDPAFQVTIRPLLGLEEPRVIAVRDRASLTVYEARGAPIGPTQEGLPVLPLGAVVHPSGKGIFALIRDQRADGRARTRWAELAADGAPRPRTVPTRDGELVGIDPDAPCETAVDLGAQVAFVLGTTPEGARHLFAFASRDGALAPCFDVEVPARVTLAQDPSARAVMALSPHEHGVEIVRLGASPPVFQAAVPDAPPLDLDALILAPRRPCAPRGRRLWTVSFETFPAGLLGLEYLYLYEGAERRRLIADALDERELIVPRYAVILRVPKPGFAEDFAAAVEARFPGDPEMAQLPAQRAARAGDWASVKARLAPLDPTPLRDAAAQHHDHLLGVALLMTGDAGEARRVLARGAARPGCCDLSTALALVGEPSPGPAGAAVRALEGRLRAADARLAAGDPSGARRALSGLVIREAREVQTLARRARAWLQEPDETAPGGEVLDGFSRRLSLAAFVDAHACKAPTLRRELPFSDARWDEPTLDALAGEAKAWLDEDRNRPRPPVP